ncbi:MAG: pyruvate dehydrogenase complex dihydrolipoamide acetyltransferase [Rhizobiales bacterium]|nr:pyruvate dehydrogenase complex dihydrolipoamide acetyltransferase [Hyphomicrobiales bacterium]
MPTPILMPALSPTMEEGTLAKWLVKEGDKVRSGDVIAEIETDKATMEVEAVDEGTVARILVAAGTEGVKVNTEIALLLGEDEEAGAKPASASTAKAGAPSQAASPAPAKAPAAPSAPAPAEPRSGRAAATGNGSRVFSSPLARRLAEAGGIAISAVMGSGPHGRIVKRDVEAALASGAARSPAATASAVATVPGGATAAASAPAPAVASGATASGLLATIAPMADDKVMALYEAGSFEVVPHDNMRKTIARRLTEAKLTIPHFYLSIECRLDELLAARKRMNDGANGRFKLSVNDFIIKAMGLALKAVPDANATWTEKGMLRHTRADVGVAVAVEGGLFTPLIRHADLKSLSEISNEMKDLAGRARDRKLKPHEYQGGTTSISNLGMFGIKRFDAVINPPHATILAVGAGEERIIAVGGQPKVATMMSCTLSCDHRVVDGALGAELLGAFKAYIEDPVRMLA